jgi:hypothetical protein
VKSTETRGELPGLGEKMGLTWQTRREKRGQIFQIGDEKRKDWMIGLPRRKTPTPTVTIVECARYKTILNMPDNRQYSPILLLLA